MASHLHSLSAHVSSHLEPLLYAAPSEPKQSMKTMPAMFRMVAMVTMVAPVFPFMMASHLHSLSAHVSSHLEPLLYAAPSEPKQSMTTMPATSRMVAMVTMVAPHVTTPTTTEYPKPTTIAPTTASPSSLQQLLLAGRRVGFFRSGVQFFMDLAGTESLLWVIVLWRVLLFLEACMALGLVSALASQEKKLLPYMQARLVGVNSLWFMH